MCEVLLRIFSLSRYKIVQDGGEALQTKPLTFAAHAILVALSWLVVLGFRLVRFLKHAQIKTFLVCSRDISRAQGQRLHIAEVHLLFHIFDICDLFVVKHILFVCLLFGAFLSELVVCLFLLFLCILNLFLFSTIFDIPHKVFSACCVYV